MTITRTSLAAIATLLALGYGSVQAAPTRVGPPAHQIGGGAMLANAGPGVKDTCTESTPGDPKACDIDDLTRRCDDAGGGMSSLPGGGVDCDLGPE